ncbi:MAG TPA: transketolase [Clostridiales bacterium]|nr:transketolase [Clostridiales bacterium]
MDLKKIAFDRRLDVLEMVYSKKSGHIGGSMSCMDILTSLYYSVMDIQKIKDHDEDRDRFILSKGHCSEALYTVLADCGFFDKAELETYTRFGTKLAEHPTKGINGIEIATGALGHGLSAAVGMAISLKNRGSAAHVYVLMGDGEQAEGSVWEATMAAAKFGLDNLTMIIDRNRLQISGGTEDVMPLDNLAEKYGAFGCHVVTCNGHDYGELIPALKEGKSKQPTVVIADTIKGYGSSVMENKADWHHNIPTAEEYEQIKADLTKKGMEVS